jgi:hypothetical protein
MASSSREQFDPLMNKEKAKRRIFEQEEGRKRANSLSEAQKLTWRSISSAVTIKSLPPFSK